MIYDSVMLIGYHGVGKDTIANKLIADYDGVYNAKFSAYPKDQLAYALNVPTEWMNDKSWRSAPVNSSCDLTSLDFLNLMFHGRKQMPEFAQKTIDYCFGGIPKDHIPIFTDVRDLKEKYTVLEKYENTFVVRLKRDGVLAAPGDKNVNNCTMASTIVWENYSVDEAVVTLAKKLELKKKKKSLALFVNFGLKIPYSVGTVYNTYEPLSEVVEKLQKFCDFANIYREGYTGMLNIVLKEVNLKEVPTPEPYSCLVYHDHSHANLLPLIRQKTDLQLIVKGTLTFEQQITFTTEEISNALFY